jgi:hypothetical protein
MINYNGVVKRHWIPGELVDGKITSNQIPHPALFVSRKLLDRCNPPFDSSYRIAADLKHQLIIANIIGARGKYIPIPFVKMQLGGTSTSGLIAYILGWIESRRAWNEVHGRGGLLFVCKKVLSKIFNYRRD